MIDKIQGGQLFPLLLTAAPLLLGLSLALGLWSRLSTFLGILYLLHLYFINFSSVGFEVLMFYQLQIAVLAVLFLAASGRTLGIDGLFWRNRLSRRFEPTPPRGTEGKVQRVPTDIPAPRPDIPTIPLHEEGPAGDTSSEEEKKPEPDRPDFGR